MAFSGSGSGTSQDPYIITTLAQLNEIRDDLTAYYELGCDIDCSDLVNWNSGAGWETIGGHSFISIDTANNFTGQIDGKGYKIIDFYANKPTTDYVSFINEVNHGTIKNLVFENPTLTGRYKVATVAIEGDYDATFENIKVINANITGGNEGSGSYRSRCGGIVAQSYYHNPFSIEVKNCYFEGTINATGRDVGGIMGACFYNGTISGCYSNCTITGTTSNANCIGGIAGYLSTDCVIEDSYNLGSITGNNYVGGIVGDIERSTLRRSYDVGLVTGVSCIGALCGGLDTVYVSYWNGDINTELTNHSDWERTTAQMKDQANYSNWDFDTVWAINSSINDGYPYLINNEPLQPSQPTTEITSLSYDRAKISNMSGVNISNVVFQVSKAISSWEARATLVGSEKGLGIGYLVGSGGNELANTDITFQVDNTELTEGNNDYIIAVYFTE